MFSGASGELRGLWTMRLDTLTLEHVRDLSPGREISYAMLNDGRLMVGLNWTLWASTGTKEGTTLLVNRKVGRVQWLTSLGKQVVFAMNGPDCGEELFRSDGTKEGTVLVKDICPGPAGSGIKQIYADGTRAFFQANDGVHGPELWVTDATPNGTFMVKDIFPGTEGSDPHYFMRAGAALYFVATDGNSGIELWRTDGTETGTRRVSNLAVGPQAGAIWSLISFKRSLFFCAESEEFGEEVFCTLEDGEAVKVVKDIVPERGSSHPKKYHQISQ